MKASSSAGAARARDDNWVRSFDPVTLGGYEADAWVAYYRRRWGDVPARLAWAGPGGLRPALAGDTARGVVRDAGQPGLGAVPGQRPRAAPAAYMRRFYALVARHSGETFDLDEAARREVEWWRVHRYLQRGTPRDDDHVYTVDDLTDALAALYAHVYGSAGRAGPAGRARIGPRRCGSRTTGSRPARNPTSPARGRRARRAGQGVRAAARRGALTFGRSGQSRARLRVMCRRPCG